MNFFAVSFIGDIQQHIERDAKLLSAYFNASDLYAKLNTSILTIRKF